MAEDSDVKLDIEDLRNTSKMMHKSIERVEDLLNSEFCHFEMTVMVVIDNLTNKVNSGHSCYNSFELEALAGKGKQSTEIRNSLNMATEDQDVNNPTQEELSGNTHIIPVTKGKAPKYSHPVASSSKMQIDNNTQALAMACTHDEWNPFMDKLSDVLAIHMGKISDKLDRLVSAPPSQGEEPVDTGPSAVADDEVVMVEGPMPPDLG